jgi:hypothetical protein
MSLAQTPDISIPLFCFNILNEDKLFFLRIFIEVNTKKNAKLLFLQLWKTEETISMKVAYSLSLAQFIHHDLCSYLP